MNRFRHRVSSSGSPSLMCDVVESALVNFSFVCFPELVGGFGGELEPLSARRCLGTCGQHVNNHVLRCCGVDHVDCRVVRFQEA